MPNGEYRMVLLKRYVIKFVLSNEVKSFPQKTDYMKSRYYLSNIVFTMAPLQWWINSSHELKHK